MCDVIVESYQEEKDKVAVERILTGSPYFEAFYYKHAKLHSDNIFVARYEDSVVGFLSFGGFYKQTDTVIFVDEKYRRKGIGSLLIKKADNILRQNEITEYSWCSYPETEAASRYFLEKNGYYRYYSSYVMEQFHRFLPECNYSVRHYQDEDYLSWHNISDIAFFIMREKVGFKPSYFNRLNENERKRLFNDRDNRFVLLDNGIITAVGAIAGNELHLLAVRPDLQSRGYGSALASFLINEIIRRGESKVWLNCVVGNSAKHLYDSLGFRTIDIHHFYIKQYRPDSRMKAPIGYTTVEALVSEYQTRGIIRDI